MANLKLGLCVIAMMSAVNIVLGTLISPLYFVIAAYLDVHIIFGPLDWYLLYNWWERRYRRKRNYVARRPLFVFRPMDKFIFLDRNGERHEFNNAPENSVVVKLKADFWCGILADSPSANSSGYHAGEEIVIPREVAALIDCEIVREWK